jgi:hypothetical protein
MNALRIPSFMPILQHFSFFGNGLNAFFQIYAARQNTPARHCPDRGVLFGKRNEVIGYGSSAVFQPISAGCRTGTALCTFSLMYLQVLQVE